MAEAPERPRFSLNIQGYLLAGILTITPLAAVWLVFNFLLGILSSAGHPLAAALADGIEARWPQMRPWLDDHRVQWFIAVIGARLFELFERVVARVPLVDTIYAATKKLVDVLRQKPD